MNIKLKTTALPAIRLLVNGRHGQYVPQCFATSYNTSAWSGFLASDMCILEEGPDNENYWEAWQDILDKATYTQDGFVWRLHQDGDLWALCFELMTDEEKKNFGMDEE